MSNSHLDKHKQEFLDRIEALYGELSNIEEIKTQIKFLSTHDLHYALLGSTFYIENDQGYLKLDLRIEKCSENDNNENSNQGNNSNNSNNNEKSSNNKK